MALFVIWITNKFNPLANTMLKNCKEKYKHVFCKIDNPLIYNDL